VEAAIGSTAEATAVKSAPGTIGMSRRADRSRDDQDAENAEREFHRFAFRITVSRATPDRQLSSRVAGCKVFTRQFYLTARCKRSGCNNLEVATDQPSEK
jgi:hypothetical protein